MWVDVEQLGAVRREVEALSRRGIKLGTGPIELRELRDRGGRVEVAIQGATPQIGGYRIVATLHHEGEGTAVEIVPEEAVEASRWGDAEPWCEHCAVRRRRNITYVLRRGAELRQVGSSCLADFTGERDPVRAARQAQLLAQADRELAHGAKVHVNDAPAELVAVEEFLGGVCTIADREGFRSRRRADEADVEATADPAWESVQTDEVPGEMRPRAQAVIRWARGDLAERVQRSEFEDRLVWALSRPRLARSERYLVAAALSAYAREVEPYVGGRGQRVELELWVEMASSRPRQGRFGKSYLHRLRDGLGRLVVWYATDKRLERNSRYRVRGTVGRWGTFGREAATIVHRCRVERL